MLKSDNKRRWATSISFSSRTESHEAIKKVKLQFDKYSGIIRHGLIPIWNIRKLALAGIGFPVPCEDHKNYEHRIPIKEYGIEHAYLAEDDPDIRSISQRAETFTEKFRRKWDQSVKTRAELARFIKGFGLTRMRRFTRH